MATLIDDPIKCHIFSLRDHILLSFAFIIRICFSKNPDKLALVACKVFMWRIHAPLEEWRELFLEEQSI